MAYQPEKPGVSATDDDLRHDDEEFEVALEPKSSKAWLNLLKEAEEAFEYYNDKCDNIDRLYANLENLSSGVTGQRVKDREFQLFWANCEVMKPSIYAKPPIPVVVPKFKDRKPVYQAASELLERCATVAFDIARIDDLMHLVRDDVAIAGRGVAWVRYESGYNQNGTHYNSDELGERVCIDHKDRRDFLHSISRSWREVTWVAGASYLTRSEARERFRPYSGDAYQDAEYKINRDANEIGGADNRERAKFWEVWHRGENRVVWVAEGVEDILDEDEPHLKLQEFFPCPKPAYGTTQRGSLIPVPDVMQYEDQLQEINLLTSRIHALSDAIEAKGFYPAGGSEIADAVEAAIATKTNGRLLVPIANWAAFGGTKEVIIWLPIAEIAQVIVNLVTLRKQIIDDVYQIMGLSDIMRGATDPMETLGAQQLKTQYGSTRIRDKQQEIVRIARDLVAITSEIICEKFKPETMILMSQTQLPTSEMKQDKAIEIQRALQQAKQQTEMQLQQQQDPQQQQQIQTTFDSQVQQGIRTLKKLNEQPTIEQVLHFLEDNKARAFVLDIETDSTIMADEMAEKQRRTEFVGVLGNLLPQLGQLIMADPESAPFCGEILKFAIAPFRGGRALDGVIDDYVERMKMKADQPRGDDPVTAQNKANLQIEQMKTQQKREADQADNAIKQQELQQRDQNEKLRIQQERELEIMKMRQNTQQDQAKAQTENLKQMHAHEQHQMDMIQSQQDMRANQEKMRTAMETARMQLGMKQQDMRFRQQERQQNMVQRAQERQQQMAFRQQQMAMRPVGGQGRRI